LPFDFVGQRSGNGDRAVGAVGPFLFDRTNSVRIAVVEMIAASPVLG
jgi:hypothetical protein